MAIKLKVQTTETKLKPAGSDVAKLKTSVGIPIYPHPYEGTYTVTPSGEEQTLETDGLMMTDDVTVAAASLQSKEVTSSATAQEVEADEGYYGLDKVTVNAMASATPKTISKSTIPNTPTVDENGLVTATTTTITGTMKPILSAGYADADFSVPYTNTGGSSTLQLDTQGATTITPSTSEQTVVTAGKYMTGDAKVSAMPNATWRGGSRYEPVLSLSVSNSGLITGEVNTSSSVQPISASGYAEKTHNYPITIVASNTQQLSTVNGSTVTPTESEQTAVAANKYTLGAVKVGAISSTYVGSGIPVDPTPTASGKTVTIPTGYYSAQTTKDVATGTEGTPTATKGTVSNHSVSVTPSVTNTTGYISGSTKTGTAVTVSASELESGTKEITANGTNIDVTGYAAVDVSVPAPTPTLETVTKSYTPTTSQQTETITPSTGYDGIGEVDVTVGAMPTMTLPSSASNTSSGTAKATISANTNAGDKYLNIPTGYNGAAQYYTLSPVARGKVIPCDTMAGSQSTISYDTISNSWIRLTNSAVSNRPIVETAGYVTSGTTGTSEVQLTANVDVIRNINLFTVHENTITVPPGYYPNELIGSIGYGTAGTPTATKGTVNNHTIEVTPSVTNTAGYIQNATKTGTAVTVSASELVSGNKAITANGTDIDVANYSTVSVNVSGGTSNWTLIASGTLTVNTTSTSAGSAGTISCGSAAWTATDIIWVRIRGQSGKRNGYFYGSDAIFANYRAKNGSTSADSVPAVQYYRVGTDGLYVSATGSYGVYAYSLATNGTLTVRRRYNATNTLTINDKFDVEVYKLTLPTGKSLFT